MVKRGVIHEEWYALEMVHHLHLHGLEGGKIEVIRGTFMVLQLHCDKEWGRHLVQSVGQSHKHAQHTHHFKADTFRSLQSTCTTLSTKQYRCVTCEVHTVHQKPEGGVVQGKQHNKETRTGLA